MKDNYAWIRTAAGKVSVVMIILGILFLFLAWSTIGKDFMSIHDANTANNILVGIGTNFIGIAVTVSFVQYLIEKEDNEKKRKDEIMTIKRYHKYMSALIRKFLMYYISVTTRILNRDTVDFDNMLNHRFKFSDMADMFEMSMYINAGFLEPSIVLFYRAEERLQEYMRKMLENIDFKYNEALAGILLDFATKSVDFDMRGNIIGAINTRMSNNMKLSEYVSQQIADENNDWIEMFQRGKLKGNIMLTYVLFYFNIQDQIKLLKKYTECIEALDCE